MCGIVGYIGDRPVQEVLLEGLRKLEYRGYDSAGISILSDGRFDSVRAVGNLDALDDALDEPRRPRRGAVALAERAPTTGIGHTRWATHGRVNEANAHPHSDDDERVHVVVNGIVENYMEIKQALIADGATFSSETDAEVIAHLISQRIEAGDDLVDGRARRLRAHPRPLRVRGRLRRRARAARRRAQGVPAGRRPRRGRAVRRLGDPRLPRAHPPGAADRERRDRRRAPRRRRVPQRRRRADRARRSTRSTGARRSPRRAATRRSCSRRSTSRRTPSRRRSPTAPSARTASTSTTSARSTTPSCATATASSSSPAAPRTTPA